LSNNRILSFFAGLLIWCTLLKFNDNVTVNHPAIADFHNSSKTQLSTYIYGGSALINTIPPLVPASTFTILHYGSLGSGFKNRLFLSAVLDDPSHSSFSFWESHSVQHGLPFSEILLALCILRI